MKLVTYEDKIFVVDDGVLEPAGYLFPFCKHIVAKKNDIVLDLGTGTGFLAIVVAHKVRKVVATDIDGKAFRNARKNVVLNGLENKVEVLQGDMFQPVADRKFDLIISTLPQMPTPEWKIKRDLVNIADDGGPTGRELIDQFSREVNNYLNEKGRVCMFHFNFLDSGKTIKLLKENGLEASVSASWEIPAGRFTLERIQHIESLGHKLVYDRKTGNYKIKIDVIAGVKI